MAAAFFFLISSRAARYGQSRFACPVSSQTWQRIGAVLTANASPTSGTEFETGRTALRRDPFCVSAEQLGNNKVEGEGSGRNAVERRDGGAVRRREAASHGQNLILLGNLHAGLCHAEGLFLCKWVVLRVCVGFRGPNKGQWVLSLIMTTVLVGVTIERSRAVGQVPPASPYQRTPEAC